MALPIVHCTTEQGRMFPPSTVKVTEVVPTIAAAGEAEMFAGAGSTEGEIVKGVRFERAPELETSIFTIPAEAISETGMMAVSCVALTNVVARADVMIGVDGVAGITQKTAEPFTKYVPVTVRVTPEGLHEAVVFDAVVEDDNEEMLGGSIVNDWDAGQAETRMGADGVMLNAVTHAGWAPVPVV